MVIVNQDKDIILNLDNVSTISTDEARTSKMIYAKCNNNDLVELGEYESEERTKEVLQEIATCYTADRQIKNFNRQVCFEMPEK